MANLKEIRSRISSVSSTMQITGAMKMVSAAKLKKAQDAILAMKPYAYKLKQLLEQLSSALGNESVYNERPEEIKNVLIVAITSNRGLCGAFNSNIIKKALELENTTFRGKNVLFYTVGKKGNDVLKKTDKIFKHETHIFDNLNYGRCVRHLSLLTTTRCSVMVWDGTLPWGCTGFVPGISRLLIVSPSVTSTRSWAFRLA